MGDTESYNQHLYKNDDKIAITDPIVIIGIAMRLPGEINNQSDLWNTLINKKDTLSEIPLNRFSNLETYINNNRAPGKIVTRRGGFIKDIEYFDANFFQISPKEAEKLDPQQRLLLETSFNAIEDAGLSLEKLSGSKTGVFIGCWLSDFEHKLAKTKHDIDVYSTTGSGRYPLSGRLSFFYNLQGPSITVDTACSSSLVALHLAIQSLKNGESDIAFAGAANTILDPFISIGYSRSNLLSDYGSCHFGSKDVGGYVRSEGAATVILKRLSDALKDGNQIYATLPGSAVNNDGQSDKYMLAPSAITQEIMIRTAHKSANINAKDIQYIEAHGTGTKAGDPAEINSIWKALSDNRTVNDKVYVGSVKTNIGHTESVAGFAGLFKTILAIKHKSIPPNLHFYEPNPDIDWQNTGIEIPTKQISFDTTKPILAGVNAFGITGTNAHIIVQEYIESQKKHERIEKTQFIFPLSALNEKTTQKYAETHLDYLNQNPETDIIEYTLNIQSHKANLQHRNAIIFNNKQTLLNSLSAIKNNEAQENIISKYSSLNNPKVVFVFPGQGSQWLQMGKQLYNNEPIFKRTIDEFETAILKFTNWKLTEVLYNDSNDLLSTIDIIQPALVAIEIAIAKLWINIGVLPNAVIGHSMGEVAAAYICNAISIDDAANIICTRSSLMKSVSGKGAMGYIALSEEETLDEIAIYQDKVSIGVNNSPKSTVISGDKDEVEHILKSLDNKGIFSRAIKVDVASHSKHMDGLTQDLFNATSAVKPTNSNIKFFSTVEGKELNGELLDATYWVKNLRQPVQFGKTVQELLNQDYTLFIECSPHAVLTQAIQENIEYLNKDVTVIASLEKEKDEEITFLKNVSLAYTNGIFIDWKKYFGTYNNKILLPSYPWQKEYYWINDSESTVISNNQQIKRSFVGTYTKLNTELPTYFWQSNINLIDFPYLEHHKVSNQIVFPAAAFFEIINETSKQIFPNESIAIRNLYINNALVLEEGKNQNIQIIIQQEIGNEYHFTIDKLNSDNELLNHCKGIIQIKQNIKNNNYKETSTYSNTISKQAHYDATFNMDLQYDTSFQLIDTIQYNQDTFNSRVYTNSLTQQDLDGYNFHPSVLDACFQTFLAAIYSSAIDKKTLYVPASCKEFQFLENLDLTKQLNTKVTVLSDTANQIVGNIIITDDDGNLIAIGNEFVFKKVETEEEQKLDEIYYNINWEKTTLINKGNTSNNILIIHNNAEAELLNQLFIKENIKCNLLDISSFSQTDFQQALLPYKDSNSQLLFILDKQQASTSIHEISKKQEQNVLAIVNLIQAINNTSFSVLPRLWIITQNAQQLTKDETITEEQHQVAAFCRVAWNEHYELKPSTIDITDDSALQLIPAITNQNNNENEIAIRNNEVYVARLEQVSIPTFNTDIIKPDVDSFCVDIKDTGLIDNLYFKETQNNILSDNDVLIEVKAVGVNFMNLMSTLGIYPGKKNGFATLGIECVGVIQKVGKNITHLNKGDRVMGMANHTLASHVVVNGNAIRKIPSHLSFQEAATIPAVFLTAYYSLVELAKIKSGDKLLIHAATGGVGLAAIQIANYFGAEVYATAGNEEKRSYLKSLGIQHVYDSRSIDFYEQILSDTNQQGVDIVLNSLTGDAMYKSIQLLKNFGCFLEIGKKDIFENSKLGLHVFQNGLSYHTIDLESLLFKKPELLGELLQELIYLFEEYKLQPLEKTIFPLNKVKDAFAFMNASKHIGKVVIDIEQREDIKIEALDIKFKQNATYILTGGTGGLGLTFVEWMFENNATNFILISRNIPSSEVQNKIDNLKVKGANINCIQCNISDIEQLKSIFDNIDESTPLKGVFHLAGILEDATIQNINPTNYLNVLRPKIAAYNLHKLSEQLTLDYFVLFSSSAVLFASIGQASYVSANAFMDALAINRRSNNLPALSIQFGTVADIGLAATEGNRGNRLKAEGISPLQPIDCTTIFTNSYNANYTTVGAFYFNIQKWKNNYTSAKQNPYFDKLLIHAPSNTENTQLSFLDEIKNTIGEKDILLKIEDKLKETISIVTKVNIQNIDTDSTFKSLGIDSLMSVQLKNKLEKIFSIALSVTTFWTYPSIKKYAKFLISKLDLHNGNNETNEDVIQQVETSKEENISTNNLDNFNIDTISVDDISRLLDDELKNL